LDFDYIDQSDALARLCERLAGSDWVALDTEFIREKSYYPKLCLIQIGTPDWVSCIDPLSVDIGPLLDALYRDELTLVLHAARQDLEIFYHLRGRLPGSLFDTQLAAPLLGLPEQMGYGNFIKARLNIELAKGHARTDWAARPLSDEQLRYAADDVRYLAQAYEPLREELQARGRLEWLQADLARLGDPALYDIQPQDAWRRLKGAAKLRGPALSVLQSLAAWRESQAKRLDRPRKWILQDDALFALARLKLCSVADMQRVRGLPAPLLEKHGAELLQLIAEARTRPPQPLPEFVRPGELSTAQEGAVDVLMGVLRILAADADLHVSVLASRKDLERLVRGERELALLSGWRRSFAGETLLQVLSGERGLQLREGHLQLLNSAADAVTDAQ